MKKFYVLFSVMLLAVFMAMQGHAQVDVSTGGPVTTYANIKLAFDAINLGTHTGTILIEITGAGTYTNPAAPAVLNSSGAGSASYSSILIRPSADGVSIFATTLTGRGVIELKGADNVTIDGDNPNTPGTNRNLTIYNSATATTAYTSVVRICNATAVTSSDNITIKNCIINGNVTGGNSSLITSTSGSSNASFGIYCGGNGGSTATDSPTAISSVTSNTAPSGTTINNFVVENNAINQCARAIVFNGAAAGVSNLVTVTGCTIGGAGSPSGTPPYTSPTTTVYTKAVWLNGLTAATVTGNTIQNIFSYIGTTITAIEAAGSIGTGLLTISGNTLSNIVNNASSAANAVQLSSSTGSYSIHGNSLTNIRSTGSSCTGILCGTSATSGTISNNVLTTIRSHSTGGVRAGGIVITSGNAVAIQNNMIAEVLNIGSASFGNSYNANGILLAGGNNHKVYYNSVNLYGVSAAASSNSVNCLAISANTQIGIDVRNNVFSNTVTGGSASDVHTCVFLPFPASATMLLTLNNNAYFTGNIAGKSGIAFAGTISYAAANLYTAPNFIPGSTTPATNFRSFSTLLGVANNDDASFASTSAAPFTSATNLHIPDLATTQIESGGAILTVTTDIDGQNRYPNAGYPDNPLTPATAPDMGADEFAGTKVSVCSGVPAASTISGPASVCINTGTTLSLSTNYTDLGITYQWKYAATSGGPYTNLGTATTQATGNLSVTTYYICDITCTLSSQTYTTIEKTVEVTPLPTVLVDPTAAPLCFPGGSPVTLTASGASTYSWSPATGLNQTTGPVVQANPSTNTTYTVTGTDALGCVNTATASITITTTPSVTAFATPDNICLNANSQLQAVVATFPARNYTFAAGTGASLDPMTEATTVIASGNDDTPNATPLNIGFTFNFNGTDYTQYSVSPDGWILLGGASAVSQYTNSITSTTNIPKIYPYWDDMATGTTGSVKTMVSGSAPNRIFIIQWYVTIPRAVSGAANSTFQAWLYETSGKIEFRYGTMNASAMSASVGLSGTTPASNFNCVTIAAGTNSTTVANDANAGQPAAGTMYTFTSPTPAFSWSPVTFLDNPNIQNPLASGMTSTTEYTVTANNAGCTAQASVTVSVGTELFADASANPSGPVCNGTTVTLTGTPTGGGGPYTYSWKVGTEEVSTSASFQVTPENTTTYDLTIIDNCAQVATSSVTVTVKPVPTAGASSNSPICQGSTLNLIGTTDIGTTFDWTGPNGFTSDLATPSIIDAQPAATGEYSFTATLDGCTSEPATTLVTVHPNPGAITITPSPVAMTAGTIQPLTASGGTLVVNALAEDFNDAPAGWTTINNSTGGTPANAAWMLYLSSPTFQSNDNSIFVLSNSDQQGSGGTTRTELISPAFSTEGFTSLTLSFYHRFRIYTSVDKGLVEISLDGGATWEEEPLALYNSSLGADYAWVQASLDLSGFIGQPSVKIRFKYYAEWGYYWGIDNVLISGPMPVAFTWSPFTDLYSDAAATTAYAGEAAATVYTKPLASITYTVTGTSDAGCTTTQTVDVVTCPDMPETPVVTFVSPFHAELEWSYATGTIPSGYILEVATDADFLHPIAGSPFSISYPTMNLSVSGLTGSMTYYYRLKAVGACDSPFSEPGFFTTQCTPLVVPFIEDFETGGFPPSCWVNQAVSGPFTWSGTTAASAGGIGNASALANFYNQYTSSYELLTQSFDLTGITSPLLKFNFAYASYVVEIDQLDLYYSTDYGKTWLPLLNMPGGPDGPLNTGGVTEDPFIPAANEWCTQEVELPAGANMVKFVALSAYGNNLYIDNISVSDLLPATLSLQNVTVTGRQAWMASGPIVVAGDPSYFTVLAGGRVNLVSGESVALKPGTTVMEGGYLNARIFVEVYCNQQTLPGAITGTQPMQTGLDLANFTLYPNPTGGMFTLALKGDRTFDRVSIDIYGMTGEKVLTETTTGEKQREFNIASLPAGVYFVKITASGYVETIKLVKTR